MTGDGPPPVHPLAAAALPTPLRVLQIEDSADDAALVLRELQRAGYAPSALCVDTPAALGAAMKEPWDVIVSDYRIGAFEAPAALAIVREVDPDVPFIIVSGSIGEESAVLAMRAGAQDFFLKDRLQRLGAAIAREMERARTRVERRAALAELRDTRVRLQSLFDQAIVGMAQFDLRGRFVFANETFCTLAGRSFAELLHHHDVDVVAAEDAASYSRCLGEVRANGEPCALEIRYVRPNGDLVWVNSSVSALRGADGAMTGTVAVVHDITRRRKIETEREELVRALAQTVEFNEMFVGILGHDLRNPLATISMSATMLAQVPGYEAASPTVERISRSAGRMHRMIEQLLDFTRIRVAGGIPLDHTRCDLATIAHQALDEIVGGNEDADVRLEVRGRTEGVWDRDRLLQIVSNLVANAVTHGAKGRTIRVGVDGLDAARVHLFVENGGSIPEGMLPFVFEPLHPSKTRGQGGGLGLGLYIVRRIALAHGGDVLVTSSESRGTYFDVVLPREATPAPPPAA